MEAATLLTFPFSLLFEYYSIVAKWRGLMKTIEIEKLLRENKSLALVCRLGWLVERGRGRANNELRIPKY